MKRENELRIFRRVSIEYLKRSYYNSISYLFDTANWKPKSTFSRTFLGRSINFQRAKRSLKWIVEDLNVFKTSAIMSLKLAFRKGMASVFKNKFMEPQAALFLDDYSNQYWDASNVENSNNQFEKELNIFRTTTIENLKLLYNKSIGKK